MTRFKSVSEIPLIPVEEYFTRYPDPTGYFSSFGGGLGGFESENGVEKLLPLRTAETPDFPRDTLPGLFGEYAEALAKAIQTPRAFTGSAVLAMLSMASLRKWKIEVVTWQEFMSFWAVPLLESGERKTPVLNALLTPINEWVREKDDGIQAERAKQSSKKEIFRKRAQELEKKAARLEEGPDQDMEIVKAGGAAAKAAEVEIPPPVKLFVTDATSEGMKKDLAQHNGRMSIITDEGQQFRNIAGRYTNDQGPDSEVYNQSTHGGQIATSRMGSEDLSIPDPEITMLQAVQPAVLMNLRNQDLLRGTGFFARCYPVLPESLVGGRDARPGGVPEELTQRYSKAIRRLLNKKEISARKGEHHKLIRLSDGADKWFYHLQVWVEKHSARGKRYATSREWTGKFVGYTARIAGLIHIGQWAEEEGKGGGPHENPISADTMVRAIRIGFFFLEHAQVVFGSIEKDEVVADALFLLGVLKETKDLVITRRELYRKVRNRFETPGEMQPALDLLQEKNYILVRQSDSDGKKGRPSVLIDVNPAVKVSKGHDSDVPVSTSPIDPSLPFFEWVKGQPDPPPPSEKTKIRPVDMDKKDKNAKNTPSGTDNGGGQGNVVPIRPPVSTSQDGYVGVSASPKSSKASKLPKKPKPNKTTGEYSLLALARANRELETEFNLIWCKRDVGRVMGWLETASDIGVDLETFGVHSRKEERNKLALSFVQGKVRLIQLSDGETTYLLDTALLPRELVAEVLDALHGKTLYLHNGIFDLPRLKRHFGVDLLSEDIRDTMIISRLARSGEWYTDAEDNAFKYKHDLGHALANEGVANIPKDIEHRWHAPLDGDSLEYARNDVRYLIKLERALMDLIEERGLREGLQLFKDVYPVYLQMQYQGVPLDIERFEALREKFQAKRDEALSTLEELAPAHPESEAGGEWVWNNKLSPDQKDSHGNNTGRNGARRALELVGTKVESLKKANRIAYLSEHPDAELLKALHNSYIYGDLLSDSEGWVTYAYEDGRLYPNVEPFSQVTGRTAYKAPPLQNTPKNPDEEGGVSLRACIKPPEGVQIVKADYASQELRIVADLTGDENLIHAFMEEGRDPHVVVAEKIAGRELVEDTAEYKAYRGLGKRANYGFSYGAGAKTYQTSVFEATSESISFEQAQQEQTAFREAWPGVFDWQKSFGSRSGSREGDWYTLSPLGRRRYVDRGWDYYALGYTPKFTDRLNAPVQSTGADMLYTALKLLREDQENGLFTDCRVIITTHDEIVLEAPEDKAVEACGWLQRRMRDAAAQFLREELTGDDCVEGEVGPSWGEGEKIDE